MRHKKKKKKPKVIKITLNYEVSEKDWISLLASAVHTCGVFAGDSQFCASSSSYVFRKPATENKRGKKLYLTNWLSVWWDGW